MAINKIIGYTLLVAGLLAIVFALWQSYQIFSAKSSVPLVFRTPEAVSQASGQTQIDQVVRAQLNKIIPADSVTKILNLAAWSIFAGLLIIGGGAISGIGVKLIK